MMTLTLALSPAVEAQLRKEAAEHGVDEAEYVAQLIETGLSSHRPLTGAEVVAYWEAEKVGDAWSRKQIGDSAAYARSLRRKAEMRGPLKPKGPGT